MFDIGNTRGEYTLGESIVPIKFKKISVSKDGDLTEDYFYVRGRKNPLHVIRINLYKSHKPSQWALNV